MLKALQRYLKLAGLPTIRLHDLRHAYAGQLLAQGTNIKVVQERLGYVSVQITLDIYGHLMPGQQRAVDAQLTRSPDRPTEERP